MKRSIVYAVVVCVLLVAAGAIAIVARGRHHAEPDGVPAETQPAGTFFPTEQLWIVKDVTAAIANIATALHRDSTIARPSVRQVPRSDRVLARFQVTPAGQPPLLVNIYDHIWAPGAYVTVAASLLGTGAQM